MRPNRQLPRAIAPRCLRATWPISRSYAVLMPAWTMVPGAVPARHAPASSSNADAAGESTTNTSPGFVQNCPPPMRLLDANSAATLSPRSPSAPGRMTTGLMLDISA